MKAPVPNIQEILRQNPDIGRQLAAEAMKGQTAQFKAQTQVNVPTYAPPQPQAPAASNPLAGLMNFLGGTQQPPQPQSQPTPQAQSRKITMPTKPVQMPSFIKPLPPKKELAPPTGAGISDILKGIQAEQKAAPLKSALKKTPTSSAGKSPKNSVVIKL
jgi:hypothetical protein